MNTEFGYALAFATGVAGAFHCLGMCSGIAAGFFVRHGWEHRFLPHLYYHGTRILVYTMLGVTGAFMSRVLVQTGIVGKGQGVLMMIAGVLIILIGLGVLGVLPWGRQRDSRVEQPDVRGVHVLEREIHRRHWTPVVGGLLNGFVPCSLVFSVAVKAVGSADPVQAGLLMAAFGLGTLPTMAAVSVLGAVVGGRARGIAERLAGLTVIALGLWTLYEGLVFFDIMRGLSNW
ncbi:MAG: sulfite exporter TauE/SafE family protein [Pseudomonadota bacterium]|nr:sulfite exporter TauE/SafE family protein [Pseudomonadota bacterium]